MRKNRSLKSEPPWERRRPAGVFRREAFSNPFAAGTAALPGGRTLALQRSAELRFGEVCRESAVHADSEIGAPLSVMLHGCSVKVRPSHVRLPDWE